MLPRGRRSLVSRIKYFAIAAMGGVLLLTRAHFLNAAPNGGAASVARSAVVATPSPAPQIVNRTDAVLDDLLLRAVRGDEKRPATFHLPPTVFPPLPAIDKLTDPPTHDEGIIVCEPITTADIDSGTADFAAGCGDYLYLAVGGQPQLGLTPPTSSITRGRRELNLTGSMRLSVIEAVCLARITGATEIAVGTAARNGAIDTFRLSYRIYSVATARPLGDLFTAVGTPEQVLSQLPALASKMARALGVSGPQIEPPLTASVPEMAAIGRVTWSKSASAGDTRILEAAGSHDALSAFSILPTVSENSATAFHASVKVILGLARNNALAWARVGEVGGTALLPFRENLAALRKTFPRNYGLACAERDVATAGGSIQNQIMAAADAVCDAPRNPDAWTWLASALNNEAVAVSHGRIDSAMNADERLYQSKLYALEGSCVRRAIALDPQNENAWARLSIVATYTFQKSVARDAFWKAESYNDDKTSNIETGLWMFQKRWGGASAELSKVVDVAVRLKYSTGKSAGLVAKCLRQYGFSVQADKVTANYITSLEKSVKSDPNSSHAHWQLGLLRQEVNDLPAACVEYRRVVQLLPNNLSALLNYANALADNGSTQAALAEFQALLKSDPDNLWAPLGIAAAMNRLGDKQQAERYVQLGLQRNPNAQNAHFILGEIYLTTGRLPAASLEFRRSMELGGTGPVFFSYLTGSLALAGDKKSADHWGDEGAMKYAVSTGTEKKPPRTCQVHAVLAATYLLDHQFGAAETQNKAAISINPKNVLAVIDQGYVFNETGRRHAARTEWKRASSLSLSPYEANTVRDDLATYPENGK